MASTSNSKPIDNSREEGSVLTSHFKKTVSLRDWWLIKSDSDNDFQGKRLAVAGFACGEQQALRVFHSAPITKRFDVFTLETADGIIVIFQGFINRQKTIANGFSSQKINHTAEQVFDHFLFGFPPCWEEYAENCFKQSSFSVSPKENDIGNVDNDATKNIIPSSSCTKNAVNLMEDNRAVEAEPSGNHAVDSFERLDDSDSNKRSKKSIGKSKTVPSASLGSITTKNAASEERSTLQGAGMDNSNETSFDHTARIQAKYLVLGLQAASLIRPKISEKMKNQTHVNKDGLNSGITNFSTTSLPQDSEAVLGCINEEEIIRDEAVLSPTVGDSSILEQPSNKFEDITMFSSVQTVGDVNNVSPSATGRGSMDAIPSISGFQKHNRRAGDLDRNKNYKPVSGCSVKQKNKESTSQIDHQDKKRLKKCSYSTHQSELDTPQAMLKSARRLKKPSENLESKEKNEQLSLKRGGSSMKKARRKIFFDTHVTPCTQKSREEKGILFLEFSSLKRSRSGRLLLPTLDFWRNQIPVYDADRNITGIQQELNPPKGSKLDPRKKQKRRPKST
ncbi:kinetochore-associated protein KNL-2 homolog isoform X2 [Ricinus communis]|uniref:kinetochore-associated protein KNL-2 homolog isoform X2 n=1 Tax=Ricinus communis TaxID=3988 RepID=UPI00201A6856|nr:kinetochore-associated protein KNL-2 homolog isoform X2 [Ricinus communis]